MVNRETLEVVVQHLSRVAAAENKMDTDNLALLFGQVLLWPDSEGPMDFKIIAGLSPEGKVSSSLIIFVEAASNVRVADALIRYSKEIFPVSNTLTVPRE